MAGAHGEPASGPGNGGERIAGETVPLTGEAMSRLEPSLNWPVAVI